MPIWEGWHLLLKYFFIENKVDKMTLAKIQFIMPLMTRVIKVKMANSNRNLFFHR